MIDKCGVELGEIWDNDAVNQLDDQPRAVPA